MKDGAKMRMEKDMADVVPTRKKKSPSSKVTSNEHVPHVCGTFTAFLPHTTWQGQASWLCKQHTTFKSVVPVFG